MKSMIAVLAFVMLSQAQAQNAQPQVSPQPTGSPIYILNNQRFNGSVENNANSGSTAGARAEANQVQEQPTTVVQDTPLKSGAADNARRSRQDTEAATEDGIVQALEKARMNDELRRREKFNNALENGAPAAAPVANQAPAAQPVPAATPVPAPIVQVVPVVVQPVQQIAPPAEEPAPVKASAEAEMKAPAPEVAPVERRQEYYVSGLLGLAKYPSVVNVRANMAAGFAVGMLTTDNFGLEASFLYSSYELDEVFQTYGGSGYTGRLVDMTQYNLSLAGKYHFLTGRFRPYVGAVGSYARRNYYDMWGGGYGSDAFRNSNAFDAGALVGLDFAISPSFAIGFDFRYMTNIFYRQTTSYPGSYNLPRMVNDIERLDYYTSLVSGKYTF